MNRVKTTDKAGTLNQDAPANAQNSGEDGGSATSVKTAYSKSLNISVEAEAETETGEHESLVPVRPGESIEGAAAADTETLAVPANESDVERP